MNNCVIVGVSNCHRCKLLKQLLPYNRFIQLPDRPLGFGDTFARWMMILGIEKCSSCKIRHHRWNRWFPYFWRGDKFTRDLRNKLVELDQTIYPVLLTEDFSESLDIHELFPDFSFVVDS